MATKKRKWNFDEELARKLCTPENSNKWVAEQLNTHPKTISRWRMENNLMSTKSATQAENAAKRKKWRSDHGLSYDARMANEAKMTYGTYKAMQFEEPEQTCC